MYPFNFLTYSWKELTEEQKQEVIQYCRDRWANSSQPKEYIRYELTGMWHVVDNIKTFYVTALELNAKQYEDIIAYVEEKYDDALTFVENLNVATWEVLGKDYSEFDPKV